MTKWLKNNQGMKISPEAQRSENLHRAKRKKHATNSDKYSGRKLIRYCPKCGAVITKSRHLHRADKLGIYRDTTVFICDSCNAIWLSKQTIKVHQKLKRSSPKISNKEFKAKLALGDIQCEQLSSKS